MTAATSEQYGDLGLLLYLNSFPYLKLGYGAALSLILAAIVLAFTLLQMNLTRRSAG